MPGQRGADVSRIEVLREEFGSIRYRLLKDDGTVDEKKVPVDEIRTEARRLKKGLRYVLEKREGVEPSPETITLIEPEPELPQAEELPEVQRHTHAEFGLPLEEHSHTHEHPLTDHTHEHSHTLESHEHAHEHDLPAHGHSALGLRLEALEALTEAQAGHRHAPHSHENLAPMEHSHAAFDQIAILARGLLELKQQIEALPQPALIGHDHALEEHDHSLEEHSHAYAPEVHEHLEYLPTQVTAANVSKIRRRRTIPHEHNFATLTSDGKWRCSLCGDPKGIDQ